MLDPLSCLLQLRTLSGNAARTLLTDQIAGEIQREMVKFFKNDNTIGQGLHYLAMNYRSVSFHQYYFLHYFIT